jgi:dTDP-glucose 4,6-dehydratase
MWFGTFALLEIALRHWSRRGARYGKFRFVHVSTAEVFGTLAEDGCFDLGTRYAQNSPYAASKAVAGHSARPWQRTYGLPVLVTNCANNYGPRPPCHDFRYSIDPAHAENTLDWKPKEQLETGLAKTIDRYLANPEWFVPVKVLGQLGSRTAELIRATL